MIHINNDALIFLFGFNLILFIYLIFKNYKTISKCFEAFDKRSLLILILIMIISLIVRVMIWPPAHIMYNDEFYYMEAAKYIIRDLSLGEYERSIGWPFILSISFLVFGVGNYVALYTSLFFGMMTAFPLYLLIYRIIKNRNISLISTSMFLFLPTHMNWSTAAENNIISLFFIITTVFFFFLYYEKKTISLFFLCLVSAGVTSYMRPENILIFVLFIIGIILYKTYRILINPKLIVTSILFILIFVIPAFFTVYNHMSNTQWIESDSKGKMQGDNFSLQNLIFNTKNFSKYLIINFSLPLSVVLLFIIGIFYSIKINKNHTLFFLSWFLFFYLLYFTAWFQTLGGSTSIHAKNRLLMLFYPVYIVLSSYGLLFIKNKIIKKVYYKKILTLSLLILLILSYIPHITLSVNSNHKIRHLEVIAIEDLKKENPLNCIIVSLQEVVLEATTNFNIVSAEEFLFHYNTIFNENECVLVFKDITCGFDWFSEDERNVVCNLNHDNFTFSEYKTYSYEGYEMGFYQIKLK